MKRLISIACVLLVATVLLPQPAHANPPPLTWQRMPSDNQDALPSKADYVSSNQLAFGDGKFIMTGEDGTGEFISTSGLAWTKAGNSGVLLSVFYCNGQWLGVTSSGNAKHIQTSRDGVVLSCVSVGALHKHALNA